jgi:hypothetical protein
MTESMPAFKPQVYDTFRTLEEWVAGTTRPAKQSHQTSERDSNQSKAPPSDAQSAKPSAQPPLGGSVGPSPTSDDSFLRRKIVGPTIGVLLIVILLGGAWQIYEDIQTRKLLKVSLAGLSSSLGTTKEEQRLPAISIPRAPDQTAEAATRSPVLVEDVNEMKQQLLSAVNDIAAIRRDVEQLSTKHEELSREVAAVKTTEQTVSEKVSSLNQPTGSLPQTPSKSHRPAPTRNQSQSRKGVPSVVNADAPKRSDVVASSPAAAAPPGTASLNEGPPRPPLPVPTVTTTPPPVN